MEMVQVSSFNGTTYTAGGGGARWSRCRVMEDQVEVQVVDISNSKMGMQEVVEPLVKEMMVEQVVQQ